MYFCKLFTGKEDWVEEGSDMQWGRNVYFHGGVVNLFLVLFIVTVAKHGYLACILVYRVFQKSLRIG